MASSLSAAYPSYLTINRVLLWVYFSVLQVLSLSARPLPRLRGAYHSLTSEGMRSIRTRTLSVFQTIVTVFHHDESSGEYELKRKY